VYRFIPWVGRLGATGRKAALAASTSSSWLLPRNAACSSMNSSFHLRRTLWRLGYEIEPAMSTNALAC
jgi:hypothetical protein